MIDLRLWRAALLGVPLVAIVAMFSLQDVPRPLQPGLPPDAFDAEATTTLARDLAESHPEPRPGSQENEELAQVIQSRFTEIPAVEISEQRFSASFEGEDVELRNLIAVLPGQSERQVALIAHRDAAVGSGAASGIASTAVLLEIASALSGSTKRKTLVFISTDGGEIGALGARRFAEHYSERHLLDAAIVLSQPASPEPEPPLVVPWSTGDESTGVQLERAANAIVSEQVDAPAGDLGPLEELFRLALPAALGEQGPLVKAGLDSVRLSSAGERPLPPERDQVQEIDRETLERFGRSALSLLLALDAASGDLEHGPRAYVGLAGNILPGWTLSLLALSLLLPAFAAAGGGLARAAHSPGEAGRALAWAALRAVPVLLALLVLFGLTLVGMIPDPDFPFDPAAEAPGRAGTIAAAFALLVLAAAAFLVRPLLPPGPSLAPTAPGAALFLAALASLGVWAVNPYLGLLAGIGIQGWVLAAATDRGRLAAAGLIAAGLLPALALVIDLAARFGTGLGVWGDLLLMLSDGQLGGHLALLAAVLAGAALAIVASRGPTAAPDTPQLKLRALVARGRELEERRAARRERSGARPRGPRGRRRQREREREEQRQRRRAAREAGEFPELEPEEGPDGPGTEQEGPGPEPEGPEPEQEGPEREVAEPEPPDGEETPPQRADEDPDDRGSDAAGEPATEPKAGAEPEPDQPEPARDPRIWSKPGASTSAPPRSRIVAPSPLRTSPI